MRVQIDDIDIQPDGPDVSIYMGTSSRRITPSAARIVAQALIEVAKEAENESQA